MSKHGVFVLEEATALTVPITGKSAVQVVIGTAPVNMVDNPGDVVNVPVYATRAAEAMAALGYCKDFQHYTLCQTMYATNNIYQVSPVVYINVLDPAKHRKALDKTQAAVSLLRAVVEVPGILRDGLVVEAGDAALTFGTDYTLEYETDGSLVVNLIAGGAGESAKEISVSGQMLDPEAVTKDDIIGAYNPSTGKETGMEVIRQIYPKLGVVPGIALAP